jgi:hypothetical protein
MMPLLLCWLLVIGKIIVIDDCHVSLPLCWISSHLFLVQFLCIMLHTKLAVSEAVIVEFELKSLVQTVDCCMRQLVSWIIVRLFRTIVRR